MEIFIIFGILISGYLVIIAKRIQALVRSFRLMSFFLFLETLLSAFKTGHLDLYVVSFLLLVLKVILIPILLLRIVKKIEVDDNLGFFVSSYMSLLSALAITYFAWGFSKTAVFGQSDLQVINLTVAFSVCSFGLFIMIFRLKALAQVVGLLVMENGVFLLAAVISKGMPFFVEIAIFLDVLVSVIILGLFIYRINKLFTHIDVNKLSRLRG